MPRAANKLSVELIQNNTKADPKTGCWNWTGSLQTCGYGQIKLHYRNVTGHRASWMAHHGPIPRGIHVLHHCDNPACCNPDHLYLGNAYDNMRDMAARKRRTRFDYKLGSTGKLTDAQIRSIRASSESTKKIAAEYDISLSHIRAIRRRSVRKAA